MNATIEKESQETLALPLGAIPVAFSTLRVYLAENQAGDDPPVPMVIDGCGEWVEEHARRIGGFGFSLAMILPGATDEKLAEQFPEAGLYLVRLAIAADDAAFVKIEHDAPGMAARMAGEVAIADTFVDPEIPEDQASDPRALLGFGWNGHFGSPYTPPYDDNGPVKVLRFKALPPIWVIGVFDRHGNVIDVEQVDPPAETEES